MLESYFHVLQEEANKKWGCIHPHGGSGGGSGEWRNI